MWVPKEEKGGMAVSSIFYAIQFNNYLNNNTFDYAMIRGDRYELLFLAATCVYRGVPIIHIEGGDMSGTVDNKIRHAITCLSDYHFCTNEESHRRLVNMGVPIDRVWDLGSLDVEFARSVKPKVIHEKPYIFVAYHPIENEDEKQLDKALRFFKKYDIIRIESNKDYGRGYGDERFSPEDYINLMRGARCCVGNSSSLLKEASILGVPVVLVGGRQNKRLTPQNVLGVPCDTKRIELGIEYQLKHTPKKDLTYFKKNTSQRICQTLRKILRG